MTPETTNALLHDGLLQIVKAQSCLDQVYAELLPTNLNEALRCNPVFPRLTQGEDEPFEQFITDQYVYVKEKLSKINHHLLQAELELAQLGAVYAKESQVGKRTGESLPQGMEEPNCDPNTDPI